MPLIVGTVSALSVMKDESMIGEIELQYLKGDQSAQERGLFATYKSQATEMSAAQILGEPVLVLL